MHGSAAAVLAVPPAPETTRPAHAAQDEDEGGKKPENGLD
jgi:hypothetical protein